MINLEMRMAFTEIRKSLMSSIKEYAQAMAFARVQPVGNGLRYFKHFEHKPSGDIFTNDWGPSIHYVEVDREGIAIRYLREFDNRKIIKYHPRYVCDVYGGLPDEPLLTHPLTAFEITEAEFEERWRQKAVNCEDRRTRKEFTWSYAKLNNRSN